MDNIFPNYFWIVNKKHVYFFLSVILLWSLSMPIVSSSLIGYLEKNYTLTDTNEVLKHEAVVVLGGMVRQLDQGMIVRNEFTDAVDRVLAGIELIKADKANRLILTRVIYLGAKENLKVNFCWSLRRNMASLERL